MQAVPASMVRRLRHLAIGKPMRCPGCGEGEGEDLATGEGEVRSE